MSMLIRLPKVGTNEDSAVLVGWLKKAGEPVQKGESICEIETSKAMVTVDAEAGGFLHLLVEPGTTVTVGDPIGAITDAPDEDVAALQQMPSASDSEPAREARRWTRKAELVARRLGVDLAQLARQSPEGTIGEEAVLAFHAAHSASRPDDASDVIPAGIPAAPTGTVQRVVILGGAGGGGAALIVDALTRIPSQRAVGVLDRDPALQGRDILGVPVIGSTDDAERLWREGRYDAAVIAFNTNLKERAAVFQRLSEQGVPFTNVIDPSTDVRLGARIGTGNVILANCHIGPEAVVGDNNFLSSFTCIEHHCRLGSHCAFGPSVSFSGRVTVGDRVRFATKIGIEPGVSIGDDAVIASGLAITQDIPPATIAKSHVSYTLRQRRG